MARTNRFDPHVSAFGYFVGGYLHQDWDVDHATVWDALQNCLDDLAQSGEDDGARLAEEVRSLLLRSDDDIALELTSLGCGYYPPGDHLTNRQWLVEVAVRSVERAGGRVFRIAGDSIVDQASFVAQLKVSVPLDPPLVTGRSWDAIEDSVFGGIILAVESGVAALVWVASDVMAHADPHGFAVAVDVLESACRAVDDQDPPNVQATLYLA